MESEENMSASQLDQRDIANKVRIYPQDRPVSVYAVAVPKNSDIRAQTLVIQADHGKPLSSQVYDATKDVFLVRGISYMHIGEIPISYCMQIDGVLGWQVEVPITEEVLKRYIPASDFKDFELWKAGFEKERCVVSLLQVLKCH